MRFSIFFLFFSAVVSAEPLPPILDFYPECSSTAPQLLVFSSKMDTKGELVDLGTDPRFSELLKQLQTEAAAKNAQALTIENIDKTYPMLGKVRYEGDQSVDLKITAKLFNFCQENTALSKQQPPYNALGQKVIATTNIVSIDAQQIVIEKVIKAPVYKEPDNHLVSLEQGIAGVIPGQTKSEIITLLGSPSVAIQLKNAGELWGYGRKIWLKFDEHLEWISTDSGLLSTEGLNNIDVVDAFDNSDWSIEGKVRLKTELVELQQKLPSQFQKTGELQMTKQQSQRRLTLDYQKLKNYSANTTQTLLMNFTLSDGSKTGPKVPDYSAKALSSWLTQATQQPESAEEKLKQLQIPLHRFERGIKGSWIAAGNHLLLQYQGKVLTKIRVGGSIFKQQGDNTELSQLVLAAGFPITKAQFQAKYPDALDSGYELTVYEGTQSIVAGFASEDENAPIESLELTLI